MTEPVRKKANKVLGIILNVVLYLFMALCVVTLLVSTLSKKSDGAVTLFGKMQMRIVVSPSMEKSDATDVSQYEIRSIPVKSMVFIRTVPEDEQGRKEFFDDLQVGDVLTFRYVYTQQETITHRLVDKQKNGDGYFLYLKGDNVAEGASADTQVIDTTDAFGVNYVIGKVTGQSRVLGFIVYALQQPLGMALIVIVPCAAIAVAEAIKIGNVLAARKRERVEAENKRVLEQSEAREREIELLKQQLSALEQHVNAQDTASTAANSDNQQTNQEDNL